jgi:hypothetical protein
MSAMQRSKGQRGEREAAAVIAALTGYEVTRRVRQHDGDSDLVGVPGWSVEVKRHKAAPRAEIASWWRQTEAQATRVAAIPLLVFKADRADWRFVWPVSVTLGLQVACMWRGYEWTCEGAPEAWAAVMREVLVQREISIDRADAGVLRMMEAG